MLPIDHAALWSAFVLRLSGRLVTANPKQANGGHTADGAISLILVLHKVGLFGYRLRGADVDGLNLGTRTSRGVTLRDGYSHGMYGSTYAGCRVALSPEMQDRISRDVPDRPERRS
jgi:hypothetical protein